MFNFDFSDGYVILRIMCGLFFIPHAIGKITAQEASLGFFTAAGFKPPKLFLYITMVVEWIVAVCLILGIYTTIAAYFGAAFMLVAFLATLRVSKGKWLWNLGGAEYPMFWGLCCLLVAVYGSNY